MLSRTATKTESFILGEIPNYKDIGKIAKESALALKEINVEGIFPNPSNTDEGNGWCFIFALLLSLKSLWPKSYEDMLLNIAFAIEAAGFENFVAECFNNGFDKNYFAKGVLFLSATYWHDFHPRDGRMINDINECPTDSAIDEKHFQSIMKVFNIKKVIIYQCVNSYESKRLGIVDKTIREFSIEVNNDSVSTQEIVIVSFDGCHYLGTETKKLT
jgi:hypothetical protein